MIVVLVGPLVLAWTAWQFLPTRRGSPESIRKFLKVIGDDSSSFQAIDSAAENCFVIGASASTYKELFAKANKAEKEPRYPHMIDYEFSCTAKRKDGQPIFVRAMVDNDPQVVVSFTAFSLTP